ALPRPADQPGDVHPALGEHRGQEVAELVVAGDAHRDDLVAQLDQVDGGAGGGARGGEPDLVDEHGVLPVGDAGDGPGEDVDDVDADCDDGHGLNRQTSD